MNTINYHIIYDWKQQKDTLFISLYFIFMLSIMYIGALRYFFLHIIVVPFYPGRVLSLFSILQPVYYYAGYHIVCNLVIHVLYINSTSFSKV